MCLTIIRETVFPYVFGGLGDDSALNHTIAAAGVAVKANPEPKKKVSIGSICVGDIDLSSVVDPCRLIDCLLILALYP